MNANHIAPPSAPRKRRLRVLPAALLLTASVPPVDEARAMGSTTHEVVSYIIQQKADGDLRSLLDKQQDSYRNGTIFPDVANAFLSDKVHWNKIKPDGGDSADDLSHGEQHGVAASILNDYLALIKDRCGRVYKESEKTECKEARAFFLGMISHVLADGPWHADFIGYEKTKDSIVSVREKCGGSLHLAHDFADTGVDICVAKQINNGDEDAEILPKEQKARLVRKNSRVGQGCPKGAWWHVGGGDGLLGACFECPDGFSQDLGKRPDEMGVCYKKRYASCSEVDVESLGIDVGYLRRISLTANSMSFSIVNDGYRYAAQAYNLMNDRAASRGIGDKTSAKGLVDMAKSKKYLGEDIPFAHLAGRDRFSDSDYADDCAWGLKNTVDHDGGIKVSAFAARVFIDKVWNYLQTDQDFSIHRFGAYNYGIRQGGVLRHCLFPDHPIASKRCS